MTDPNTPRTAGPTPLEYERWMGGQVVVSVELREGREEVYCGNTTLPQWRRVRPRWRERMLQASTWSWLLMLVLLVTLLVVISVAQDKAYVAWAIGLAGVAFLTSNALSLILWATLGKSYEPLVAGAERFGMRRVWGWSRTERRLYGCTAAGELTIAFIERETFEPKGRWRCRIELVDGRLLRAEEVASSNASPVLLEVRDLKSQEVLARMIKAEDGRVQMVVESSAGADIDWRVWVAVLTFRHD